MGFNSGFKGLKSGTNDNVHKRTKGLQNKTVIYLWHAISTILRTVF